MEVRMLREFSATDTDVSYDTVFRGHHHVEHLRCSLKGGPLPPSQE